MGQVQSVESLSLSSHLKTRGKTENYHSIYNDMFVKHLEDEIKFETQHNSFDTELNKIQRTSEDKNILIDNIKIDKFYYKVELNSEYSYSVQKWIGYIESIGEDSFKAKLFDKTEDSTYEIAEFSKEDVSPDDLKLFREGAVFYWSVGYEIRNGQRKTESILRFKRSVNNDMNSFHDQVFDISNDLLDGLNWEDLDESENRS